MKVIRYRPILLVLCLATSALAILGTSQRSHAQQDANAAGPPKPGCPFKIVTNRVQTIFGPFDRAMHNGDELEGGGTPNVIEVEHVLISSCVFQRISTREVLTFTDFIYPENEKASAAFERAGKASNSTGPFYTSTSQQSGIELREGPGRLAAYFRRQVVIVHWMVVQGTRPVPKDLPGSRLEPIAMSWLQLTEK